MRLNFVNCTLFLLLAGFANARAAEMQFIRVADDQRGFVTEKTGERFTPWGLNYGNAGRLIEDFWNDEWPTVTRDFQQMKRMGANVVRVHLQFGKFMDAADRPNRQSLERLGDLLKLAESTEIYLDVTGLACYRTNDVPPWYDTLSDEQRWNAQAKFWELIAERCAKRPAVFCYDLMNEPLAPGGKREPGKWYSGSNFGGFDFLQYIALNQGERPREQVARDWIATLSRAIRSKDAKHPITVGLLPWSAQWHYLSGFIPETVAPELSFVSVHIYPDAGKVDEAIEGLKKFAVGKPLLIEETFPLTCSATELKQFLVESRPIACGWVGHYDGKTVADLQQLRNSGKITAAQLQWLDWLTLFEQGLK